jgi:hypothetical protein
MTKLQDKTSGATLKTPECEKVASPEYQAAIQFLEWLGENGYIIADMDEICQRGIDVVQQWAGVDARALEKERRALLDRQRTLNAEVNDGKEKSKGEGEGERIQRS